MDDIISMQTFYRRTKKSGSGGSVVATNAIKAYVNKLVIHGKTVNGVKTAISEISVANGVSRHNFKDLSGLTISTSLNANSWETIAKVCAAGKALDYWSIGDEKTITFSPSSSTITHTIKLVDLTPNRYKLTNGTGYSQAVFMLWRATRNTSLSGYDFRRTIDPNSSFSMGWKDSEARRDIQSIVSNSYPAELINNVAEVSLPCVTRYSNPTIINVADSFFLPSSSEVNSVTQNAGEGLKFEIYTNGSTSQNTYNLRKLSIDNGASYSAWWTRSPKTGETKYWTYIETDGIPAVSTPNYLRFLPVCFAFGAKNENGNNIPFASSVTLADTAVDVTLGEDDSIIIDRDEKKVYLFKNNTKTDISLGTYVDSDGILHNVTELLDIVVKQNATINVTPSTGNVGDVDLYYAVYGGIGEPK